MTRTFAPYLLAFLFLLPTLTIGVHGSDGCLVRSLAAETQFDAGVHTLVVTRGMLPPGV